MNKYLVFAAIVVFAVAADFASKYWAENNLAGRGREWTHPLYETVDEEQDGLTVQEWVRDEFDAELAGSGAEDPEVWGVFLPDEEGRDYNLPHDFEVTAGQELGVRHRHIQVVDDFWKFIYARNPGAAWGLFADKDESFRRPFFLVVSTLAIIFVLFVFKSVPPSQKMLVISLSMVMGGAIGNLIDRVRYGWVTDFIAWYVVVGGEEKHWPTFNVADAFISVGVTLLFIQIIFAPPEELDETSDTAEEAARRDLGEEPGDTEASAAVDPGAESSDDDIARDDA